MKSDATLEDYQNREKFLIRYIKSQIEKKQKNVSIWSNEQSRGSLNAYKDILFKLEETYKNKENDTKTI